MDNIFQITIEYDKNSKLFKAFNYKVTYLEDLKEQIRYTNNYSFYADFVKNKTDCDSFSYSKFSLTEVQTARLNKLNTLNVEPSVALGNIDEFSRFVSYGYIQSNTQVKVLQSIREEYEQEAKEGFLSVLSLLVKKIRKDYEDNGVSVPYNNKVVVIDTDKESQSSLTTTAYVLQIGMAKSVKFKTQDNNFITLENFQDAAIIAGYALCYVQSCFYAESMTMAELSKVSAEDMINYIQGIENYDLRAMYKKNFEPTYAEAISGIKERLESIKG